LDLIFLTDFYCSRNWFFVNGRLVRASAFAFLIFVNIRGSADSAKPCRGLTVVAFVDAGFGLAFIEFTPYVPGRA